MEEEIITVADALDVFSLTPDFSLSDLKTKYKNIALKVHPDRGGTAELFKTVNECFEVLALEHRSRTGSTQHDQLKRDFESDVSRFDASTRRHYDENQFDINRFNSVFEDTKIFDEVQDQGYGNWFESDEDYIPESKAPKLDPKCDMSAFNRAFEKSVPVANTEQSIIVKPVDNMCGSSLTFTEIGGASVDDYTFSGGYDCRIAHSTHRLANPNAFQQRFASVTSPEQIAAERSVDINKGLSSAEQQALASHERKMQRIEEARRDVEMSRHSVRADAHARANRMFLTNY
ncbi:DnaJ domain-containing protein [Tetraselmis virus 1]|uniref:DnaJ domain-containing protein n=1 Tax=Tetraselmis virus 1 TaxID=2060617 RepID=A0A2P0VP89_9VIRU|nr:DnaJ domain-containing protein [Tetraselmis virus 1]AUF82680.1 DnaJ domain-containing protein [Tetraselmis virus 1]